MNLPGGGKLALDLIHSAKYNHCADGLSDFRKQCSRLKHRSRAIETQNHYLATEAYCLGMCLERSNSEHMRALLCGSYGTFALVSGGKRDAFSDILWLPSLDSFGFVFGSPPFPKRKLGVPEALNGAD